jgi:hypothetical protein
MNRQPSWNLWDSLNVSRKVIGFSAVDTHENQNLRARKLDDGRVEWMGPNARPIDTVDVSFRNRWLFSEPDENGWVFRMMIDTYNEGFDYITNYILADTLSLSSLAVNLKKGHLYTAFKSLGDAKGFLYYSKNNDNELTGILGDSLSLASAASLHAVSPLPGQFRLIHNGKTIDISPGNIYEYSWNEPLEKGAYRVEIHVPLNGRLVPWLYANPIYIF